MEDRTSLTVTRTGVSMAVSNAVVSAISVAMAVSIAPMAPIVLGHGGHGPADGRQQRHDERHQLVDGAHDGDP
jgi:hypothetical protein